jgi:hypothetical protein
MTGESVSFQAIAKRLQFRHLPFLKALVAKGLERQLDGYSDLISDVTTLGLFKRILIQDSSCIKLPDSLSEHFPGSSNQYGHKKAIARAQLCLDLKNNTYTSIELKSFCDHDSTYAHKILEDAKPGDLILRDLGYSVIRIFRRIDEIGAYFISRLHPNWNVLDVDNESVIDLVSVLRDLDRKNINTLDVEAKVGSKERMEVRMICNKLTESQAVKRRIQARKNGNRKRSVSKSTYYLLGWNILITNINKEKLAGSEVYKYYSLRWRIELIFKDWKSHFRLDKIFASCQGRNYAKPELLFYLCMSYLILIYNPKFHKFQRRIVERTKRLLSPTKFAKLVINHPEILFHPDTTLLIEILKKNCCYSKRKDKQNIYERLLYY